MTEDRWNPPVMITSIVGITSLNAARVPLGEFAKKVVSDSEKILGLEPGSIRVRRIEPILEEQAVEFALELPNTVTMEQLARISEDKEFEGLLPGVRPM